MKVRCPIDTKVLTKDKVYDAFNVTRKSNHFKASFNIIDDIGQQRFCFLRECSYINDMNWEEVHELEAEIDPNGKSANEAGAKLDAGKNRVGLVLGDFPRALLAVAEIGTFGANKYTARGWLEVENGLERYEDAMMRHYFKEKAGELIDPDSELMHHAHFAWNALATLELKLKEMEQKGNVGSNQAD